MPYADFSPILKKLRSSSFKGTVVSGLSEILLLNQRNEYNFTFMFCQERVVGISIVMYFKKNFYLIPPINLVLRRLVSAGIVEHLHRKYLDKNLYSAKRRATEPKVLRLEHMLGCFQIWAAGCFISFIFFCTEFAFYLVKQKLNRVEMNFEFVP